MNTLRALTLTAILALVTAGTAVAGEPTDQVRRSVDEVLKIVQSQPDGPARRTAVRQAANRLFDFEETAKRALGPHWQQHTPTEREKFVRLFSDLLEAAYVGKIDLYQGEKITYVGETVDGDQATVKTRIVTKQGNEVPVDYRLLREMDGWRVYDVIIEGVSLVANYRTQFNKIIQTSSYDDLVKRMRAKDFSAPEGNRGRRS
ncbi:MAG: organic solvent tolerance ABC transporter substrate-binding protein [Candidatus Rokuibacteriota bacterium]|nr:MAG: organic solvent tolerance ABC transporter substrate-binding protein [Candidatus Rokubacteria bacterium]